jgi:two-component system sensor histidine kinase BaeS
MARVRAVLRRQREDLPPKHPEIRINRNLLNNAIVHTPAGGVIAVRAFPAESFLQCVIEDTGSGIAAKDLPFIFERFYRADSSRDRASGGSGLGLAIVKQIVAAHGGKTWVETSIGKGTRIYFTLPSLKDSAR